jgi:hypothetical protein
MSSEKVLLDSDHNAVAAAAAFPEDDISSSSKSLSSSRSGGKSDPPGENAAALFTRRYAPRVMLKQISVVNKWNKFATMEENGIAAAPRHGTKVASHNNNRPAGLLAGIAAGVHLKPAKRKKAPLASGNNKMADLLAGITDGVNLKRVVKPKKEEKEKNFSPTSALLAKLQARKQECLRRERRSTSSVEDEEDDW